MDLAGIFVFKEMSVGNDQVAGLGLPTEILYFDITVLKVSVKLLDLAGNFVFKDMSVRNDQVAGLGLPTEILYFDITVLK